MADSHSHTPTTEAAHSAPVAAHGHDSHGAHGHGHGSFFQHVKVYLGIGFALFFFTGVTVWLSYQDFDKLFDSHGMNIKIGLAVATFKVCLVGAWFMHLKSEKRTIWTPLVFTFLFVTGLFALFLLAYFDPIHSTSFTQH